MSQVWIKPNGELPFLYGNHVVKAHLGRITDDTPEHAGVVVLSMSGVGLVSAASTRKQSRLQDPRSWSAQRGLEANCRLLSASPHDSHTGHCWREQGERLQKKAQQNDARSARLPQIP